MTAVLAAVAAAAVAAAVALVVRSRGVERRLVAVARRLDPDGGPQARGLSAAAHLVERAADEARQRNDVSTTERRLVSALAAIPEGVVVFDHTGEIVFRNEVASSYVSARHNDVLVSEAIAELSSAVAGGAAPEPRTVDLFGPPRRTLVLRAVALGAEHASDHPPGAGIGVLVVVDDVTERTRLEAVRRDFVANISHELKTPVGALSLLAETLLAEDDPSVARRLTERLLLEAERVSRTIDDLLELSRIEAAEVAATEPVPVHVVIAEAVDRVRPAAEQRGITIDLEEPSTRLVITGDRRQLVSATYNLLDNAVKYSDPGSLVEVRARTDGQHVGVQVQDHGIGIPHRDLGRVFERFYRVDRARSRDTGGTGLGLAIVRHVAGNHAGDVSVTSQEGEGSTFTLRLPLSGGPVPITSEAG